jgi:hypothetical protein
MELEQIFYTIGALFAIAAIIYFAWEYLEVIPRITKSFLLLGLSIILFLVASLLRSHETPSRSGKRRVKA